MGNSQIKKLGDKLTDGKGKGDNLSNEVQRQKISVNEGRK